MPSTTYIAILRGINVSGSNMIKMPALKAMFEAAGYEQVQTYIQSGNVLFRSDVADAERLARDIHAAIFATFTFSVPVLVLALDTLEKVFESNPFLINRNEDPAHLHVTFLAVQPEKAVFSKIEKDKYLPDEFIAGDKALYVFCPNGYGKTKLNNNFFENKLKIAATTRNWKTVSELVRLGKAMQ